MRLITDNHLSIKTLWYLIVKIMTTVNSYERSRILLYIYILLVLYLVQYSFSAFLCRI